MKLLDHEIAWFGCMLGLYEPVQGWDKRERKPEL